MISFVIRSCSYLIKDNSQSDWQAAPKNHVKIINKQCFRLLNFFFVSLLFKVMTFFYFLLASQAYFSLSLFQFSQRIPFGGEY